MNKRSERINSILQILLGAAVILTLWNGWKGAVLNLRYEQSIHRHEQSTEEYRQYLEQTKQLIEERINQIEGGSNEQTAADH